MAVPGMLLDRAGRMYCRYHQTKSMIYVEHKPTSLLRRFVRSLWYVTGPVNEHRRERMLPSGCAHIVLSLSRDYLTECREGSPDERTAPALLVGQRSLYELVATSDFTELAGVLFIPGTAPALVNDRADLISNRTLPLDQLWPGSSDYLRSCMLQKSSPEARLRIFEDCLVALLNPTARSFAWTPHPAVRFALEELKKRPTQRSIADLARHSGWSERRFSQIFREQVGFAPKTWQRLQRFQRATEQIQARPGVAWAEMAIQCGFYDQAHLANEFRAFAGIDLTAYTNLAS